MSRMDVPVTFNFRAVAPAALRPGALYRSDALHRLNADGRRRIRELGIGRVVDLRSAFDRRIGGRDRLRGTGAVRTSVPLAGGAMRVDPAEITLRGVYRMLLAQHPAPFGDVLRMIADADAPVLVHCTAGKDRTGLVSALALAAVGVERDAIVADYAATGANLAGEWTRRMLRKVRRFRVPMTDALVEVLAASPPDVLIDTFAWLDEQHGGVDDYLSAIGVDDAVRERLRSRLLPAT